MGHKSDENELKWLRIEEAAEYTETTPGFIKAQIREGNLPYIKAGKRYLIEREDLHNLLGSLKGAWVRGENSRREFVLIDRHT